MRKLIWFCCGGVFLIMTASFFAAFEVTRYAYAPGCPNAELKIVEVARGRGFSETTRRLAEAGLIEKPGQFKLFAVINGYDRQIKPGEYEFSTGLSPARILDMLISGKVLLHRLTVPEGYTYRQIAGLVASAGLLSEAAFINAAEDTA